MEWVEVESSNIEAIGYIKETKELMVQFTSGVVYAYYDVPEEVYQDFLDAESKGKYLAEHIKDAYKYDKV